MQNGVNKQAIFSLTDHLNVSAAKNLVWAGHLFLLATMCHVGGYMNISWMFFKILSLMLPTTIYQKQCKKAPILG